MHTGTHTHISTSGSHQFISPFLFAGVANTGGGGGGNYFDGKGISVQSAFPYFSVSHAMCVRQVVMVAAALFYSSMSRNHNPLHHNWYRNGTNFISSENSDFINLSNMC